MAVQPDGKIVVVGEGDPLIGTGNVFQLARVNSTGTLDTAFDGNNTPGNGVFQTEFGGGFDRVRRRAVAVQPTAQHKDRRGGLAEGDLQARLPGTRYVQEQTGYGNSLATIDFFAGDVEGTRSVVIQSETGNGNDKIVLAGGVGDFTSFGGDQDFFTARVNANGTPDTAGYSGDGATRTAVGGTEVDTANGVAIQTNSPGAGDDKIVAAGFTENCATTNTALVRYENDGEIDNTFNGAGALIIDIGGFDNAEGVAIQPDNKIVTGGNGDAPGAPAEDFAAARFGGAISTPPPDCDPPETTITANPGATTSDNTPTFEFTTDEPGLGSSFECTIEDGNLFFDFFTCTSPHTFAALPDASYEFTVKARDAAGNFDPTAAVHNFTVSTASPPPDPVLHQHPIRPDPTPDPTPTPRPHRTRTTTQFPPPTRRRPARPRSRRSRGRRRTTS